MHNPSVKSSSNYLKIGAAAKALGVSIDTLRRWEKAGKITTIRTPGGTRLYSLSALKKLNPSSVEHFQAQGQTTEELLKKTEDVLSSKYYVSSIEESPIPNTTAKTSNLVTKFLVSTAVVLTFTIAITSWIAASYLTHPEEATRFFQNNVASGLLTPFHKLAEETVAVISPKKARELGFVPEQPEPSTLDSNILAVTSSPKFLEVNSDTQINGSLFVRDSINNLTLEGTPSASTITLATGDTTLTISDSAEIDQDVSTTSSPAFSAITLSQTTNQISSGGFQFSLPGATTTLVGTDTTQTVTKKSLSGSSNTFTNIPNSALVNKKVTITAGTNLTGGGDVELGASVTLSVKSSPSLTGQVQLEDGTAAAPSLTFANDTDTGLYRIGSNSIGLITGGSATSGITINGSGNVGIGTISPSNTLHVVGTTTVTGATTLSSTLTVSGNTNIDSGTFFANSSLNRVGIGTTTPGSTLGVQGNVGIGVSYSTLVTPTNGLAVEGNVGIGTTSPLGQLDVSNSFYTSTGAITIRPQDSSLEGGQIVLNAPSSSYDDINIDSYTGRLRVFTAGGGVRVISIDPEASSPTFRLEASGPSLQGTISGFSTITAAGSTDLTLQTSTSGNILLSPAGGGNVGIGVSSPGARLQINGNQIIGFNTTTALTGPTNGLAVSGNVGVGTTSPSAPLHIIGTTQTRGNILTDVNNTYDIGSAAITYRTIYANEVNATTLVGTLSAGNLTASTFTINSDNATDDTEDANLRFYRGTASPHALMTWDSTNNEFDLNSTLHLTGTIAGNVGINLDTTTYDITTPSGEHLAIFPGLTGTAGNVGIGTTTPGAQLSVSSNATIGFGGASTIAGPSSGLAVSGSVGIGTTSPLQALHVVGQCVTGDTRLRRRRKSKARNSKSETDEWEEVRIDQIKTGDEILTLDEATGQFIPSKVKGLMDMGIQKTYLLVTETGKQIRTTANHPYLVKESFKESNISQKQSNHSNTKGYLSSNYSIMEINFHNPASFLSLNETNKVIIPNTILAVNSQNLRLGLGFPKGAINAIPNHPADRLINKSDNVVNQTGSIFTTKSITHLPVNEEVMWVKVSQLKAGMEVATLDGWEKIVSIKEYAREQVWDIEVENTHNFVGNNIVAHNTYITGNVGVGFSTPDRTLQVALDANPAGTNASLINTAATTQLSLTGSTASGLNKKLVLGIDTTDNYGVIQAGNTDGTNYTLSLNPAGGNVGIGITTANSTLSVAGSAHIGGIRQGISAPSNGLFVDGNVGIGATTSSNILDVWGNTRITGTLTLDGSLTSSGGTFQAADGTPTSPAYSFFSDTNSGLYRFASDGIALITGGPSANLLSLNSSGNVGVGTTSPTRILELARDLNPAGTNASLLGTDGTQFAISGSTFSKKLVLGLDTTDNYGVIQAGNTDGTNYTLSLNPAGGNVGVGTTTTAGTFQVNTSGRVGMIYKDDNNTKTGLFIKDTLVIGNEGIEGGTGFGLDNRRYTIMTDRTWTASLVNAAALNLNDTITAGTDLGIWFIRSTPGGFVEASSGTHPLMTNLYLAAPSITDNGAITTDAVTAYIAGPPTGITPTNPALSLWVDAGNSKFDGGVFMAIETGNVGIGATLPQAKLVVQGNVGIGFTGANQAIPVNGLAVFGNVGIGITTANSTLSVAGSAHIGGIRQGISAPTNGLFVDGNVGIGATTSSNLLDVWGNARITGTLTVDGTSTYGGNFTLSSGQFLAPNGTSSLPSYSFTNSTSTGLYSPSVNALALQTNGASTPPLTITAGGNVGIGITNPKSLLVLSQGTNDDPIIAFKSSDVAHGITTYADTDTYGELAKGQSDSGGLALVGYKDADGIAGRALNFVAYLGEAADTTKTTSSTGLVEIETFIKDGTTGRTSVGADGNLFAITNSNSAGNAVSTRFIFDAEGELHLVPASGTNTLISPAATSYLMGGNVGIGTSVPGSLFVVTTGNVGIGTSATGASLQINGNGVIGFGTASIAGPTNGLAVSGNVGVGTTSPLQALHVVGQCVAKGTRIRRRRKGTEDEWEEVPVEDIKADDEVLSLNDATGAWEWHKVEKTMDMGIQEVYELLTVTGKSIKTTANHPYLVLKEELLGNLVSNEEEQKNNHNQGKSDSYFDIPINNFLISGNSFSSHINYYNNILTINAIANAAIPSSRLYNTGNIFDFALLATSGITTTAPNQPADKLISKSENASQNLGSIHSILPFIQEGGKWMKVSQLEVGQFIATIGKDGKPQFEKILSIEKVGRVQTYDLQIANTHNFVGGHYINKKTGKTLTVEQEKDYVQYLTTKQHQKTALADGFNASVSLRQTASPTELSTIYHKTDALSSIENASVDRTGFEPASSVGETDSLPLTYRPKFTEAPSLSQILGEDVNEDNIVFGGIVAHNTYINSGLNIGAAFTGGVAVPTNGLAVSGNVGIGITTANSALTVNGGVSIGSSNITAPTNGLFVLGNVGIGFTSPDRLLLSASDINIVGSNSSLLGAGGTQFVITGGSATGLQKKLVLGIDTTDNFGVIQAGNTDGTNYNLALNPAGGNIGIGTTSPTAALSFGSASTINTLVGNLTLQTGAGSGSGAGGTLALTGGAGGATGAGGPITLTSGAGGGTSGASGGITLQVGTPVSGNGGALQILGAAGVASNNVGSTITVTAGNSVGTGNGGAVNITAGNTPTAASGTNAGDILLTSGGTTAGGPSGSSTLTVQGFQGGASGGTGGGITLTAGRGNGGFAGGAVSITAGQAGDAGSPTSGAVTIAGGAGVLNNSAGGAVSIVTGAGVGSGASGTLTLASGAIVSGTAGPIIFATNGTANERARFDAAGNLGIGISAPDRLLHIASTINIVGSNAGLMGVGGTQFDISGATTNAAKKLVLGIDTTDNYGVIQAGNTDGTNYSLALNPAGGNVGIGTTSPVQLFQINSGNNNVLSARSNVATNDSFGGGVYINKALMIGDTDELDNRRYSLFINRTWTASLVNAASIRVGDDITAGTNLGIFTVRVEPLWRTATSGTHALFAGYYFDAPTITNNGATVTDATSLYIEDAPGGTTTNPTTAIWVNSGNVKFDAGVFMALEGNSNVGIGATLPQAKLVIQGNVGIGYTGVNQAIPVNGLAVFGNVGIGITTANSTLSVAGSAHIGGIRQGIAAPANGLFVDGNVGIGATTSSNLLDVWGNARITGTLTVDSTSTFGGNFTLSSGQFLAPNGTASLPSYSFTNSTSTGMYSPSSNALALNTNGASTPPLTITAGGNVGIGVTNPVGALQINGAAAIGYGSIPTSSLPSNGLAVSGNVGVGTTTTSFTLDVNGNVGIGGSITFSKDVGHIIKVADSTSTTGGAISIIAGDGALGATGGAVRIVGGSGIGSGGAVSLTGGTSLGNNLNGGSSSLVGGAGDGSGAGGASVITGGAGGATGVGGAVTLTTGAGGSTSGNSGDLTLRTGSITGAGNFAGSILFQTGGTTTRMFVDNAGNVGIGASNPATAKLSIQGNVGIGYTSVSIPSNGLAVSGNVGIGTTTANSTLSVAGSAHIGGIRQGIAAPTNGLFVDGNVGIGATSTAYNLDVWGTGRFSGAVTVAGNLGVGTSLTVDSTTALTTLNVSGLSNLVGNVGVGTSLNVSNLSYLPGGLRVNGFSDLTGNVGIGSSLTVSSGVNLLSSLRVAGNSQLSTLTTSGDITNAGVFLASDGTASAPAYSFSADTDNGMFRPSANALGFSTGGSSRLSITASGNIGIGVTDPQSYMTVGPIYLADTFNRTDSDSLGATDTGNAPWTENTGDNDISSNQIKRGSSDGISTVETNSADIDISITLGRGINGSSGIVWRFANTSNYWYILPATNLEVHKVVSGSDTTVVTVSGGGLSNSETGTFRVRHVGSDLRIYKNDAQQTVQSDSALSTNTRHGFGVFATCTDTSCTGDNAIILPLSARIDNGQSFSNLTVGVGTSASSSTAYGQYLRVLNSSVINTNTVYGQYISFIDPGTLANTLYGLYVDASTANTSDIQYAASFMNGNVGIGATLPQAKLVVQGNVGIGYTGVNQAIPANGLAVFGNVGIGITTANSTLSVAGSAHIGGIRQGIAAPANGLFVDGNVGIGATTSSNILDVWGNTRITGTLTVDGSTTSQGVYLAPDGTPSAPAYSFSSDTNSGLYRFASDGIALITGGPSTNLLSLNSSGNVGIGTTSPTRILELSRDLNPAGTNASLLGADGTQFAISGSTFAKKLVLGLDTTDNYGVIQAGNTDGTNYTLALNPAGGNVGIGTTSPTAALSFGSTSTINTLVGNLTLQTGAGSGSGAGGTLALTGGAGGATGAGGPITLTSGAGGGTSGASGGITLQVGTPVSGNGGALQILGAAGVASNNVGSTITLTAGNSVGSGVGGAVNITAGAGNGADAADGRGGTVTITGGASEGSNQNGGAVSLVGGNTNAGGGVGVGGAINLTAGSALQTSGAGGPISITAGTALTGGRPGGAITLTGGTPGPTGTGGAITLTSGAGGSTSGASGALTLATGTTASGDTGALTLRTGAATGENAGSLLFQTNGATTRMVVHGDGNVGIGTSVPQARLVIQGNVGIGYTGVNQSIPVNGLAVSGNVGIGTTSPRAPLEVVANPTGGSSQAAALFLNGNVGIGTTATGFNNLQVTGTVGIGTSYSAGSYSLDVAGTVRAVGYFGRCGSGTDATQCNQDVAEIYSSSEDVEPADLLTINSANNNTVSKTTKPYQNNLIGIVSTSPGLLLGLNGSDVALGSEASDYPNNADPRLPAVALSGKVPLKVSTENGPIEVGDYITSSSTPGVAMKALRPGQVVGKALESFSCGPSTDAQDQNSCQGRILTFVNVSYADPQNFFTSLSFDNEGNLIVPRIKVGKLALDPSLATASSQLTIDNGQLTINSDPNYTDPGPQLASNANTFDLAGKIASLEERIATLEAGSNVATSSAELATTPEATSSSSVASVTSVTSDSSDLDLTPPDILLYQDSAILSDLAVLSEATVSGNLTAYSADIQDNFRVFGDTQLSETLIAGDLTVDGTLSIENGSEINVLTGPLFLQRSSLAGGLDIFDGKISLDRDGTLKATFLIANQLKINDNQSAGRAKIPSGQTEAIIENPYVDENSIVLLTPDTPLSQTLGVTEKVRQIATANAKFKVKLYQPEAFDIDFSYLIIGINKPTPAPISQAAP